MRKLITLYTVLGLSLVFAAGTPAGTSITNVAVGDYKDANGNAQPQVESNEVTTVVSQVAGVDIIPDQTSSNIVAGGENTYPMDVINTGNGDDIFDLSELSDITGNGTFDVEIYVDIDGNGIIDGLDSLITDTGLLGADETLDIIVLIIDTTPEGAEDGAVIVTDVTAISQFDDNVTDTSILTTTVSGAVIDISISTDNPGPLPGDVITYSVCVENTGSAPAFNATVVTNEIPTGLTYVPGSMGFFTSDDYANANPLTDAADGVEYPPATEGDFGFTNANSVTINLGQMNAGDYYCTFFQTTVDEDVPADTDIVIDITVETEDEDGDPYPDEDTSGGEITVDQVFDVSAGEDLNTVGDPGDQILYPICFTNDGNGPDIFNITYTSDFWTWTFYWDFNGNGELDPGDTPLSDSPDDPDSIVDLGTLLQGETVCIIAVADVPPGSADGLVEEATITATSVGDPTVTDSGVVTVTVTAPYLMLTKSVSPLGDQPPGTILTYRVDVINAGTGQATEIEITDPVPDNTTYVPGSLTVAGVPKTDANDGDSGTFANNNALFTIPTLGPGGSTFVTFQVQID